MTVKELFLVIGFDNILKALRNTHRNDKSIQDVAAYKEAFDIICLTEFEGEGGEVTFNVSSPREAWYESHCLPLIANNVEGDYWENTVGKTVIRPEENPFTDAELAGSILWGMTFYGFTKHNYRSLCEELFTSFGQRAERLERKLFLPYIRDKRAKRELKGKNEMPLGIAFPMEIWNRIHHGEKHQNRAKRKRYYRIQKRIAELKRLDKRQHLIDTIHEKCGFYDEQFEHRLMTAESIHEAWRDSHVADSTKRTTYLKDLLTNYFPTYRDICEGGEELLIVAYSSEMSPLTEEEERHLKNIIHSFEPKLPIAFIKGVDNGAKSDIALQFIILSNKPINDDNDE